MSENVIFWIAARPHERRVPVEVWRAVVARQVSENSTMRWEVVEEFYTPEKGSCIRMGSPK